MYFKCACRLDVFPEVEQILPHALHLAVSLLTLTKCCHTLLILPIFNGFNWQGASSKH